MNNCPIYAETVSTLVVRSPVALKNCKRSAKKEENSLTSANSTFDENSMINAKNTHFIDSTVQKIFTFK